MTYQRHGHRVSLLTIAAACGQAPRLSERHGAGRPAAQSSAFHAVQAGAPNAAELMARLTPEEREEVETWERPADVLVGDDCLLAYDEAEKEVTLGLDDFGFAADTENDDCLTIGHMDMGWIRTVFNRPECTANACAAVATHRHGEHMYCRVHAQKMQELTGETYVVAPGQLRVAYVGDIKKTVWTTPDGPESLQLHAYGWAYAQKHGCDAYCTGLWLATEGEWLWSKEMVYLDSDKGRRIWERIYAAASNDSEEYSTGPHCRGCYARLHCQEHVLPAALADSWLAPAADGAIVTTEQALDMLKKGQIFEEVWKKAKAQIQEMVRRGAIQIVDGDKVYAPVAMPGRDSVDVKALRAELGDSASRFVKKGAGYDQFRWLVRKAG